MRRNLYFETFAFAFAVLLLEVSYTRVFSFKLVYYFTYLVIGLAMLGLGAGGVFVAIASRLRTTPMSRLLPACGLGAGVAVALGYLLVATVQLNLFELVVHITQGNLAGMARESLKLFAICLALPRPVPARRHRAGTDLRHADRSHRPSLRRRSRRCGNGLRALHSAPDVLEPARRRLARGRGVRAGGTSAGGGAEPPARRRGRRLGRVDPGGGRDAVEASRPPCGTGSRWRWGNRWNRGGVRSSAST
jgi:hypothetical protein